MKYSGDSSASKGRRCSLNFFDSTVHQDSANIHCCRCKKHHQLDGQFIRVVCSGVRKPAHFGKDGKQVKTGQHLQGKPRSCLQAPDDERGYPVEMTRVLPWIYDYNFLPTCFLKGTVSSSAPDTVVLTNLTNLTNTASILFEFDYFRRRSKNR